MKSCNRKAGRRICAGLLMHTACSGDGPSSTCWVAQLCPTVFATHSWLWPPWALCSWFPTRIQEWVPISLQKYFLTQRSNTCLLQQAVREEMSCFTIRMQSWAQLAGEIAMSQCYSKVYFTIAFYLENDLLMSLMMGVGIIAFCFWVYMTNYSKRKRNLKFDRNRNDVSL